MSDDMSQHLDADAIKARLQMNDLGNANRNHIFTVDPGHRGVNHRRVIAIRECNDETTDAGKNAAANKKATAGWSNVGNFKALDDGDSDSDINDPLANAHGQSHRYKLQAEAKAGNLEYDMQTYPPPIGNRKKPTYNEGTDKFSSKLSQSSPMRSSPRKANGGHSSVTAMNRERQHHRPTLRAVFKPTAGTSKNRSPTRKANTQLPGVQKALANADLANMSQLELAKFLSADVSKKRSDFPGKVSHNASKRTFKFSSNSSQVSKSVKATGSNSKVREPVRATAHSKNTKINLRAQNGTCVSKPAISTKPKPRDPIAQPRWTGPLQESPNFTFRSPAELCTEDQLREHPNTAFLFNAESKPTTSTQSGPVVSASFKSPVAMPVTTTKPVPEVENIMDTVDAHQKALDELSSSFAAVSLSPKPVAPNPLKPAALATILPEPVASNPFKPVASATVNSGIMASTHASSVDSPKSTAASVASAVSKDDRDYASATSSADAFWAWKAKQKPNKAGF